ncbi:MAG: S8 family serine peptidase [Ignavibacteriae bacterium]|nr:S8 family serine peptidase [Ignavibacteriota bacterium]
MKLNNRIAGILSLLLILVVTSGFINFKPDFHSDKQTYSLILNALKNKSGSGDLPNWATMDPVKDGYEGTSTNSFYEYLRTLANPPERKEVIVAVIDSGFDIEHPDLKDNIWVNEIEMNGTEGVDDDNNGYVDDFHGWNFLGNANYISLEVAREYKKLKKANTPKTDPYFIKVEDEYYSKKDETIATKDGIDQTLADVIEAEAVLKQKNITTDPRKLQEISMSLPEGKLSDAASIILGVYLLFGADKDDLVQLKRDYDIKVKCLFDTTDTYILVGDDPDNLSETNYGNNDVTEKNEEHGTHVSGIIASVKTGQAPFAKLMLLRGVPNEGDERDKDIANAIRYAADNGANIINMSAGKYFSPDSEYVVDAIKYAAEKNVLIVLSAGNEGDNITDIVNYPRKYYMENGQKKYFDNMLVVGANSWMKKWSSKMDPENKNLRYDLAAPFSNYSNTVVDIFAPGVQINSTIPGGKYKMIDGTSMASPEVAGVAAVIKAYFPDLTAAQLKDIIVSSARQYPDLMVKVKDGPKKLFTNMSKSGGVVDLMSAFKKAGEVSSLQN